MKLGFVGVGIGERRDGMYSSVYDDSSFIALNGEVRSLAEKLVGSAEREESVSTVREWIECFLFSFSFFTGVLSSGGGGVLGPRLNPRRSWAKSLVLEAKGTGEAEVRAIFW